MKVFNVKETAKLLNCSTSSIRKLIRNKDIEFFRIGNKISFTEDSIENWVSQQQKLNSVN